MISSTIDGKVIEQLRTLVEGDKHIVITCHVSPDGDAVGSTLGLCRVLRNMGKDAHVVMPDRMPRALDFVDVQHEVVPYSKYKLRGRFLVREADLIFCLDFNVLRRIDELGAIIEESRAPRVLIDHHLEPDDCFDVKISQEHASSTCELVYRVLMQLGWTQAIDSQAASCLYVGITTDTGNLTYSSNDPELYEIVAQLLRCGIAKEQLYNLAMNTYSADSLRLQGYALDQKMQLYPDKHAALIVLTLDELEHYGYKKGDTEGLVNKPLAIPGIAFSTFIREDKDKIKVSCRSQGDLDVNVICKRYFGGGGHKNAAGGDSHGTVDETLDTYFKILETL